MCPEYGKKGDIVNMLINNGIDAENWTQKRYLEGVVLIRACGFPALYY